MKWCPNHLITLFMIDYFNCRRINQALKIKTEPVCLHPIERTGFLHMPQELIFNWTCSDLLLHLTLQTVFNCLTMLQTPANTWIPFTYLVPCPKTASAIQDFTVAIMTNPRDKYSNKIDSFFIYYLFCNSDRNFIHNFPILFSPLPSAPVPQ